jgi:hypothetical protein
VYDSRRVYVQWISPGEETQNIWNINDVITFGLSDFEKSLWLAVILLKNFEIKFEVKILKNITEFPNRNVRFVVPSSRACFNWLEVPCNRNALTFYVWLTLQLVAA